MYVCCGLTTIATGPTTVLVGTRDVCLLDVAGLNNMRFFLGFLFSLTVLSAYGVGVIAFALVRMVECVGHPLFLLMIPDITASGRLWLSSTMGRRSASLFFINAFIVTGVDVGQFTCTGAS